MVEQKKETKKSNKKDSQLIIRINGEEREQFVQLCEELDTSAAREVRHFIRDFIKKRSGGDADWVRTCANKKPDFGIEVGLF